MFIVDVKFIKVNGIEIKKKKEPVHTSYFYNEV